MYSHVVDALARSTNPKHLHLADALLRQFVLLCVGCHNGNSDGAVDDVIARSEEDDTLAELAGMEEVQRLSDRTITKFKHSGALQWNDGDGHHFPSQIRITGVMRVYARQSCQRDAEGLLNLMTLHGCLLLLLLFFCCCWGTIAFCLNLAPPPPPPGLPWS